MFFRCFFFRFLFLSVSYEPVYCQSSSFGLIVENICYRTSYLLFLFMSGNTDFTFMQGVTENFMSSSLYTSVSQSVLHTEFVEHTCLLPHFQVSFWGKWTRFLVVSEYSVKIFLFKHLTSPASVQWWFTFNQQPLVITFNLVKHQTWHYWSSCYHHLTLI